MQRAEAAAASFTAFDPIALLQQIVAIDSCDPPGGELAVARLVHARLQALGIDSHLDEFAPGRANVVARIKGRGKRKSFVLSAHMDTVPVGSLPWRRSPFSGEIADGRVHGRGTSDMKGALVAMIAAADQLVRLETPLQGDLVLAFTAGESANLLGARRLVDNGIQQEIGAFLCGEPSDLDIVIVEKAALWLRATAKGRLGHVSGDAGLNAIMLMQQFLGRLANLQLNGPSHPLLDGPTIRVGRIEGGSSVNVTPDRCVADLDVRLLPGASHSDAIRQIEAIAPEGMSISVLDFKPAVESQPDDPLVSICRSVAARHLGREPATRGVSYYSDGAVLVEGLDVPFAIIGPGNLGLSGQPDEWVSIESIHQAAGIYADAAAAWLE